MDRLSMRPYRPTPVPCSPSERKGYLKQRATWYFSQGMTKIAEAYDVAAERIQVVRITH